MSSMRHVGRNIDRREGVLAFLILAMLVFSAMLSFTDSHSFNSDLDSDRDQSAHILGSPANSTIIFHIHYDGVQADDDDSMDTEGPLNPVVTDYDGDLKTGVTLKKNVPANKNFHYFILEPQINAPIHIIGDVNFTFWGDAKNNFSMELEAILYDSNDSSPGDDVVISNSSMFQDPFQAEIRKYSLLFNSLDYTLMENHTLILELRRLDITSNDFYLLFDRTYEDTTLQLKVSWHIDITEYGTEDSNGNPRTEFGGQETIWAFANISNALGIYDVQRVMIAVVNLSSLQTVISSNMSLNATDPEPIPSWAIYNYSFSGLVDGQYRINFTVYDNNNNSAWFEWDIKIASIDHFELTAPSRITADVSFNLTIEVMDSEDQRISNWSGTINLEAIEISTGIPTGNLSAAFVSVSSLDQGIVTISESYDMAPIDITIKASSGNATGETAPIESRAGEIASLTLVPASISIEAGNTKTITAYGNDSLGKLNISWNPYWNLSSSNATFSLDGYSVYITGISVGYAILNCTDNGTGLSAEAVVNITHGDLATIIVTPEDDTIWEGRSMNIYAQGFDAYGNPVDISSAVWSSEGFIMSQVIGLGSAGTINAGMIPESGSVRVSLNGVSNTTDISVGIPSFGPSLGKLPDQVGFEDNTFQLDLSDYWTDVNGTHDLTWFVTDANNSLLIISINLQSASVVNIIPQPDQSGEDLVTFWVRDPDGYMNFKEILITILEVNDPPSFINDPPNEIYVKYDLPYVFDYDYYIRDVDDDKSALVLSADPSDYVETEELTMTFTFPDLYEGEEYYEILTIMISDGSLFDSFTIKVWATSDTPPDLIEPLPDITINEGEMDVAVFDLDDYFIDVDGDVLYYTQGYEHVEIEIVVETNIVLVSSPSEWSGQTNAVFIAHDPTGALRTDTVVITVIPVNDAPEIIDIPKITVHYDSEYDLDLTQYIFDPDNSFDELLITISDSGNVTYNSLPYPHLAILYPANQSGPIYTEPYEVELLLTVTDNGGKFDSEYFTVRISDNNPPAVSVNPPYLALSFIEDGYLYKPHSLNLLALFNDPDSDELNYSYSGIVNISVSIDTDGWVNFSASPNWYGTEFVTFIATDPQGAWNSLRVRLDVSSVNDPPVIEQIPDIRHYGGRQWSMSIEMFVDDADHDLSEISVIIESPEYVKAVGLILYFDLPEDVDSTMIILYLMDDEGATSEMIEFKVEIKKTIAQMIGYPWSLIVVLLIAGILGYIVSRRLPLPHEFEDLFIIHNDGRLIYHVGKEQSNGMDRDIVSAMFTAVQEFIRDSFGDEPGGLKMLEFGEKKVLIEKSKWIYGALIYTGWPPKPFLKSFAKFFEDIEARYGHSIERWDGTLRSLPELKDMGQAMMQKRYSPAMFGIMRPERKPEEPLISDEELVDLIDSES